MFILIQRPNKNLIVVDNIKTSLECFFMSKASWKQTSEQVIYNQFALEYFNKIKTSKQIK